MREPERERGALRAPILIGVALALVWLAYALFLAFAKPQ
jgi:hypothetical protein